MTLVDTSVWVEMFRRASSFDLRAHVEPDDIVTCLPVVQEVLQGFDDQRAYRLARHALLNFPIAEAPMSTEVFIEAADLYRSARRAGLTIRSSTDCLIAACAIRHSLTVLHADRDFDALATVAPLSARAIRR